jgi:hypothetical protein
MPYQVYEETRDGKTRWCVHKKNPDDSKGDLVNGGCHASKKEAAAQARAIYANEAKEFTDVTLDQIKEITGDANGDKPERISAVLDEWKSRVALIPDEETIIKEIIKESEEQTPIEKSVEQSEDDAEETEEEKAMTEDELFWQKQIDNPDSSQEDRYFAETMLLISESDIE